MDKRLQKSKRLLRVQEQLHRMTEWKIASLQRQAAELEQAREAIIQTFNGDDALHGLFVEAASRRLQSLAGEASQVQQEQERQARIAFDQAMQVKRTERMIGTLAAERRREVEKKDLLVLLDGMASKSDASLP